MLPLLREGRDSVLLAAPEDIAVGDLLLVRTEEGGFLLHRAIALNERSVTLAGDALLTTEGPFPRSAILARVVKLYRDERELSPRSPAMRCYIAMRRLRRRLLAPLYRILKKGKKKQTDE